MAAIKPLPWKEIIKNYTLATLYLFVLTLVGALAVLVYNHFFPLDVASEMSVLAVALIFGAVVFIDMGLAYYSRPTPTLIAIVVVLSPVLMVYKLFRDIEPIKIDRSMAAKVKKYIPPIIITGSFTFG